MIIQLLSSFLLICSSLFWGYILSNPKSKTRIWAYSFLFPIIIFAYHIFIFWVSFPQENYLNFNQQSYSTGVEIRNCLLPFIISVSALYLLYSKQTTTKWTKIIKAFLFTLLLIIIGIEANLKQEENVVSQNSIQYREDSIRKASIPNQMTQPKTSGRDLRGTGSKSLSENDLLNDKAIKDYSDKTRKKYEADHQLLAPLIADQAAKDKKSGDSLKNLRLQKAQRNIEISASSFNQTLPIKVGNELILQKYEYLKKSAKIVKYYQAINVDKKKLAKDDYQSFEKVLKEATIGGIVNSPIKYTDFKIAQITIVVKVKDKNGSDFLDLNILPVEYN